MKLQTYDDSIQDMIGKLIETRQQLFDQAFKLAIAGELNEWQKNFPVGESMVFDKKLLHAMEDSNIKLIAHLIDRMEEIIDKHSSQNTAQS